MSQSRVSRRFAALLLAAVLLAVPVVSSAAPASTDSTASWSFLWEDLTGFVASWFTWGGDEATSLTGASEADLGSTLDPDGFTGTPDDGGIVSSDPNSTTDTNDSELGSTLDPDG